MISKTQQTDI